MTNRLSRRAFIKLLVGSLGAGAIAAGSGGAGAWYTWNIEPQWLTIERVDVPVPNLPPALSGVTIAQMSDLHYSPDSDAAHIRRAVNITLSLNPHIVALTGDFISAAQYLRDGKLASELARLSAPLGVFAVLGNHDYWSGAVELLIDQLGFAGIMVLRNDAVPLRVTDTDLWLVGIDDVWENHNDLTRALENTPPRAPKVLLVHEPDFADTVAAHDITLQLSGHSHGGQVRLPFIGAPVLPWLGSKYPWGLRRVANMWVYTTRGVGVISPPVRFNCRPEVTRIRLKRET